MTPHGAASAGATCPACGVETPAAARFCPPCGQGLIGRASEAITLTTQPDGTADVEAGLHLAEACLAGAEAPGRAGTRPGGEMAR